MSKNDVKFKSVEISKSKPLCDGLDDTKCIFCKCTICECGDINPTYGYVQLELHECKSVGDLGLLRRDRFSKWEKEAKDKEYADSSRMAAAKLQAEKKPDNGISLTQEQRSKIFRSPDAIQKYIKTGEY
jgi:hypothetical protein